MYMYIEVLLCMVCLYVLCVCVYFENIITVVSVVTEREGGVVSLL